MACVTMARLRISDAAISGLLARAKDVIDYRLPAAESHSRGGRKQQNTAYRSRVAS
jgi:hypothetical protein